MQKKTAIMGFGNPVRSDDAAGVYVIDELRKKLPESDSITLFDMGTGAFEVLFGLKGHDRIILVDAVINSPEPVGTVFKLPAEEVMSAPEDDPMVFLHSIKWDQALSYAKKIMGQDFPNDIDVYLIAIENTALEVGMSDSVIEAANRVISLITDEFEAASL